METATSFFPSFFRDLWVKHRFLDSDFQPGLVVCCRREEYEQAQSKLEQLNGAIYLESLSDEQIQKYLQNLNRSYIWDETISKESDLVELVRKPLFLTMLVVAYQGRAIRNYKELFEAYITQQLNNYENQGTYPPGKSPSDKQTLHYLIWLARTLEVQRETEFLIERLQPNWLISSKAKKLYRLIIGLTSGLIVSLLLGIFLWLLYNFFIGLLFGFISGVFIGLYVGIYYGLSSLDLYEKLKWSRQKLLNKGLLYGLLGGCLSGLFAGKINGLTSGLFFGLIGVFIGIFVGGLDTFENNIVEKEIPNQGIWLTLRSGVFGGLFVGILLAWIMSLRFRLVIGLTYGIVMGLISGQVAVTQHILLRFLITLMGYAPWNYARFLDYAVKHRFIQQVGGRYRFMHDLLRKHFAQMPLD